MTDEMKISRAREYFSRAAEELGFTFISPYVLMDGVSAFGFIPEYGSPGGAVIEFVFPPDFEPDPRIWEWCRDAGVFCSRLNIEPIIEKYDPSYFEELLRDWAL